MTMITTTTMIVILMIESGQQILGQILFQSEGRCIKGICIEIEDVFLKILCFEMVKRILAGLWVKEDARWRRCPWCGVRGASTTTRESLQRSQISTDPPRAAPRLTQWKMEMLRRKLLKERAVKLKWEISNEKSNSAKKKSNSTRAALSTGTGH